MKKNDVFGNIEAYLDGVLSSSERLEFETRAGSDPKLSAALSRARQLEGLLAGQAWLAVSDDFTRTVMARSGLSLSIESELAPISRRDLVIDWIQGLAPAVVLVSFAIMFGKTLFLQSMGLLQKCAAALDMATGSQVFGSHPLIIVGVVAPLIGIAIITATVTGRLRLAS
jgi:anti-sigma factor RsiW